MSEAIIVALLSVVGAILGAAIGAFATIEAAKIRVKTDAGTTQHGASCGVVGLVASVAAVIGLALGAIFATGLLQQFGQQSPGEQFPTEVVPPSSNVHLVELQKTGAETRIVYEKDLAPDEVITGDAYDFQDVGLPCNAFLITGPGHIEFAVLDGGWYHYSGVTTPEKAEELLQKHVKYLQGHWFCKDIDIRVTRVKAGE